jgi:hypothetical protein
MNNKFKIETIKTNVIENTDCVIFKLKTEKGEDQFLVWINEDGKVERTDSHISCNELDKLQQLFDEDIDFEEIYDELQKKYDEIKKVDQLHEHGIVEIKPGVFAWNKDSIIEAQKDWNECDKAKHIDLTKSEYWITDDSGSEVKPTDIQEIKNLITELN